MYYQHYIPVYLAQACILQAPGKYLFNDGKKKEEGKEEFFSTTKFGAAFEHVDLSYHG